MQRINNQFDKITLERRSLRSYDPSVKISREDMLQMLDEAFRAPSSVNLQPWRFVIVESEEEKAKLKPLIRFNTLQNDSSSAMILICGDRHCYENGEKIYNQAVEEGKMPADVRDAQLNVILPTYQSYSKEKMDRVITIDSSLAAMQFMLVARSYGYDTNAIGGFEEDQVGQAFGMDSDRYLPIMIISIGKALDQGYPSVRLSAEEVTTFK
ncbi:nitroreductase family protein [Streptococcus hyovaginalis]